MDGLHVRMGLGLMTVFAVVLVSVWGQDADIRLPPTIIEQSTENVIVIQEDQDVTLKCVADGVPEPQYEWKFKGQPLDMNDPNIKLEGEGATITVTLTPMHVGPYQCFAWNQYGKTMTDTTNLLRAVLANFSPNQPDRPYNVEEGEELIVYCGAGKSVPEPTYQWQTVVNREDKAPKDITLSRRIQQDEKGNLYFSYTTPSDEQNGNLYMCDVTNPNFGGSKFGSYSRITVNPGTAANRAPTLAYKTGQDSASDVIGIRGRELRLQCVFKGKPESTVTWSKKNGNLPQSRVEYESFNTVMKILSVEDSDEGTYRCNADNGQGTRREDIKVIVQSAPVYLKPDDEPHNINVTEKEDAVFRCDTEADPPAQVQWFMNGEVITGANKPERVVFEENNKVLRVVDVCKDCPGSEVTDLKVYQCNASNDHGYQFSAGYLNILIPTTIVVPLTNIELEYKKEVRFVCEGDSDDSTPIKYSWLKNNRPIGYRPGEIETFIEEGKSILLITTKDLPKSGAEYCADYTCIITNGYSEVNSTASLTQPPVAPPQVTEGGVGDWWWVFLIIGILLLILLILLICCLCCQRNRGDAYPVDEKERQNGNDPEKELADSGFHDYQRPEDEPIKGSRASLGSAMKLDDSDDDASLADYGDIDTGKFNEDGSFIGQYNTADRRRAADSQV